jgi:hypothetical protein
VRLTSGRAQIRAHISLVYLGRRSRARRSSCARETATSAVQTVTPALALSVLHGSGIGGRALLRRQMRASVHFRHPGSARSEKFQPNAIADPEGEVSCATRVQRRSESSWASAPVALFLGTQGLLLHLMTATSGSTSAIMHYALWLAKSLRSLRKNTIELEQHAMLLGLQATIQVYVRNSP